MPNYFVYAAFKTGDKEALVDVATCTIHQNGSSTAASGVMTRVSNGTFFYKFEYEQAGTYFARCVGTRSGQDNLLDTVVFEIVEDLRPHYLNIAPIENVLSELKAKIGSRYSDSIEGLLHELTSYSTGTAPLPGLIPVTSLNSSFLSVPGDNAMVIDKNGIGITGAKITFRNLAPDSPTFMTYSRNGYWGIYLPTGIYAVRIETGGGVFEDTLEVQP